MVSNSQEIIINLLKDRVGENTIGTCSVAQSIAIMQIASVNDEPWENQLRTF